MGGGVKFGNELEVFLISGKGSCFMLKGLFLEDDCMYFGIIVLLFVFINLILDYVIIYCIILISVEKFKVICEWLFDLEEMVKFDFDLKDVVELFYCVNL